MSSATFITPSTHVNTLSSVAANNTTTTTTTTAVQSGPYTKAQFQSTMEGSRSIKNIKEVEQLLRDYPAALELYRTGKYKVKVKHEADVERVILVEKRSVQGTSNNVTTTNDHQENNQSVPDGSTKEAVKKERDSKHSRSRTHSRDRVAPTTSITNGHPMVNTTASSIRMPSNTQPKVDQHRTSSKEHEVSVTSQPKQQQQQQQQRHHHHHSHHSPSATSHTKQKGKKSSKEYPTTIVPFVPNANTNGNMWQQQSRALQPYFSNPFLQHQSQRTNMYMPSSFAPQQNPVYQQNPAYQQPYFYGQQPARALTYQKQSGYPTTSTIQPTGNIAHPNMHSNYNYPSSSRTMFNPNHGVALPPSFHTYHSNQQQFPPNQLMYQSQMPVAWPTGPAMNNNGPYVDHQRGARHRARSVDTGPRNHPPVRSYNLQQPNTVVERHSHHRHHHQRSRPTNTGPSIETGTEQNVPLKEPAIAANGDTNGEKLTIRQLNEIFVQTDSSGRLPYNLLPNILQRFGMSLTENDLTSTARDLNYNVTEPITARRLVHVLVKLGKIARSTHQQRPPASPSVLPEDREVTDIMTQRKAPGATSTHIHSSIHPNHWY